MQDGIGLSRVGTIRSRLDPCCGIVLQTKPRQEKILAQDLAARRIEHFYRFKSGSIITVNARSYQSCRCFPLPVHAGTLDEAYIADRTKRVAKIIRAVEQDRLEWELTNLKLAVAGENKFGPVSYLQSGVKAEVTAGPMRGLQGIVEQRWAQRALSCRSICSARRSAWNLTAHC